MAQTTTTAPAVAGPVDLRSLLAMPTDQAERPKPLPDGHYIGTIIGKEIDTVRNEKKTPYLRVSFSIEEPCDDVVEDLKDVNLGRIELRKDLFMVPASMWRVTDFLDGILGHETGRSYQERFEDLRGARVMFKVKKRLDRDGNETPYNDVDTVVAAPA